MDGLGPRVDGPKVGRSGESGRSWRKWTVQTQSERSFGPKWTVLAKVDGPRAQSGRAQRNSISSFKFEFEIRVEVSNSTSS